MDWYCHKLAQLTSVVPDPRNDAATCSGALLHHIANPSTARQVAMQFPRWLREGVSDVAAAYLDDDLPEHECYGSDVWAERVVGLIAEKIRFKNSRETDGEAA